MVKREFGTTQQIMADATNVGSNGGKKRGGATLFHLVLTRHQKILAAALVVIVLLSFVFLLTHRSTNLNQEQAKVLEGISVNSEAYDEMTPAQRDAQLKRQIGYTVTDLKSKELSKGVLHNYINAVRAGKALRAGGFMKQGFTAYGVAAQLTGPNVSYQFYYQYALIATAQHDYPLAVKLLETAKQHAENDKQLDKTTKESKVKDISWQIEYTKARAEHEKAS